MLIDPAILIADFAPVPVPKPDFPGPGAAGGDTASAIQNALAGLDVNLMAIAAIGLGIAVLVFGLRTGYIRLREMVSSDTYSEGKWWREGVFSGRMEQIGSDGHTRSERQFDREYKAAKALERKHF